MWILGWLVSVFLAVVLSKLFAQKKLKQKIAALNREHREAINLIQNDLSVAHERLTEESNNREIKLAAHLKIISETLEDSANNADEASVELEQVTTLIAELTDSLHKINELTFAINRVVEQEGGAINAVNEGLADTLSSGADLEEIKNKFDHITTITQEISYIGAEAEMLALNAAIEAARAGEAGRGFTVVADNMKALAQNSQSSTKRVLSAVNDSEAIIQGVVSRFNARGETLNELVANLAQSFQQIDTTFNLIHQRSSEAELSSEKTSESIQQVSSHVKTSVETLIQRLSKLASTLTGKEVVDLSPQQVKEQWSQFDEIIDVRREKEWTDDLGQLKGVVFSTLQTDFKHYVKTLDASKRYLFICRSGGRSTKAAQMAITNGVTSVYNLDGGMLAWRACGY